MADILHGYQRDIYTPEFIKSRADLPPNGIFGYGTNPEGRHGKGAALVAFEEFDALYGVAEGLQGHSYGIITKELRRYHPRITLWQIEEGIAKCLSFFQENPQLELYMTKIGTELAGYTVKEIGDIFRAYMPMMPPNVVLPKEFT